MGSILKAVGGVNASRPRPEGSPGPLQVVFLFNMINSQVSPFQVKLAITLFQLVGVNQQLNSLTMSGSILLTWVDPRFRWNPVEHDGIDSVHLPYRQVGSGRE